MDAREASMAVKKYFQDVKTHNMFLFDPIDVRMDEDDETWIVTCQVKDVFGEPVMYEVEVDDETGEILSVNELEEEEEEDRE